MHPLGVATIAVYLGSKNMIKHVSCLYIILLYL